MKTHTHRVECHPIKHRQQGISLIELMIALVLGLLIVSAVFNVFVGSVTTAAYRDGVLAMQQNGHFGIKTLKDGIQAAGFSRDFCNGGDTTPMGGIAENTYRFDAANSRITCRGNSNGAQEMMLVSGVDQFRYLFGVDVDFDGFVDRYVRYTPTLNQLTVLSVRVGILVNSVTPIKKTASRKVFAILDRAVRIRDKLSRQVFTGTIVLKNRYKPL